MIRLMDHNTRIEDNLHPRVRRRREAVARSRTWHDRRRAAGKPEPRDAYAAIAQAASFVLAVPVLTRPSIDLRALVETATLILQSRGHLRGPSRMLVISILKPQEEHRDPFAVPNTSGVVDERLVRQPAGGKYYWTPDDLRNLRLVVERLRQSFAE